MTPEYEDNMKQRVVEINYDTALTRQFIALGGECLRDGNMYGAVIGDLPTGCAGFKKTRNAAVMECMHNWWSEEAVVPEARGKRE